ncbi:unnamed protein product [Penicillium roqueforti FM164]|uniref:Genomic scaffold, ProqFM164S01 n=1 Tax=Penicillium roqueforti (strain FM164) TaxID=1365484 RepID=W6Q563_PENRF|nr:unnamed protein product [Penicillium roqueforti FM164]
MIRLSILPVDVNVVTEYTFHHRRVLFQGLPGSHVDYSGLSTLSTVNSFLYINTHVSFNVNQSRGII